MWIHNAQEMMLGCDSQQCMTKMITWECCMISPTLSEVISTIFGNTTASSSPLPSHSSNAKFDVALLARGYAACDVGGLAAELRTTNKSIAQIDKSMSSSSPPPFSLLTGPCDKRQKN